MKLDRKYVDHTKYWQIRGSLHPAGSFFEGGGGTPLDKASQTRFSRSARKASEICLQASEKMVGESLTGLVQRTHRVMAFECVP